MTMGNRKVAWDNMSGSKGGSMATTCPACENKTFRYRKLNATTFETTCLKCGKQWNDPVPQDKPAPRVDVGNEARTT